MTDFNGVVPAIAKALVKRGYTELTPVQKSMLDPALAASDALVSAQTGSGKTVAFGLALAPTLLEDAERFGPAAEPLALVIAPTRELALQVKRELEWLYEATGALIVSCVGGMDIRSERRALERGCHIVVGTPGRLCDHIRRGALDISALKAVVLDEADEMLDLGFREDLEFILDSSPDDRRTLMFSATVPAAIAKLAKSYQKNAVRIATATEEKQHGDIEYRALVVSPSDRENAIINVLRYYEATNAIVFCSTRAAVNHLTARFHNRNFNVVALSGELTQNERSHALQAMRDGRARVCIATDVAARGIDLPGLDLVIHADLPTNPETLLHRSGRTGRAGRKGVSALIVPLNVRRKAERLLDNAGISAAWARPPSAEEVTARDEARLLADPIFEDAPSEEVRDLVQRLLDTHGAEKLAAAFVNLYRSNQSAPEDLIEVSVQDSRGGKRREHTDGPREPYQKGPRDDFGASVWFSISVGRKQNAEPRWLIPMLCRNGNLTKREIGAIKMQPDETYVEISADSADTFLQSIGPNKTMERGIRVTPLNGTPDFSKPAAASKAYAGKKAFGERREFSDERPKGKFRKEARNEGGSDERRDSKPWAKKPGKAKFEGKGSSGPKPKFSKKKG
ncbi:DEAD/DEAH box helicase [Rhizobium sp. R72]|uniref:DEAD/DEAH box helicase n=1 Tax=unclassified Rhizobium TaxID=2613769 RepID=UPI000B52E87F|nr:MULTISPECIES: DEAD/DEAH box helicase [unclassified Rhizobium]OWV96017.1 DEAD/DEAH box helicase [Rhizobium sp. R693]OWW01700.1 DEAD/DEAH box helicase [Rhizobium sp. R72]OWW01803.1 DEAD/DEAH box helicase [Rhizobium sp. R711]